MRLSIIFSALVAAVAAAPIETSLFARAGTCAALGTTTVNGKSATGPFKLVVTDAASNGPGLEGNYAHAGAPNPYPFVVFGKGKATEFYLNAAGNLLTVQSGKTYVAYEETPGIDEGHVAISTNLNIANKITCKLNKGACTLNCAVAGFSYNYLASPKYQPDWRIAGKGGAAFATNVAFTVGVITG